ncbi:membrane protease subunit (stomatin/prohibitin family) [Planomicrobium koreense]|uniref:Membrane protease subunit (Stomatin/prohibitin family) n=1 Tax=Planococcus koreensis TaxID=112331 RepID=A0A7W8CT40_9BACL|nr:SPFH domain-containing protein [Planococcus koreensis]MBB5179869.1 membrane protease subunit (stomatin/prohibitin family) [Planococcus koreensis]
MAFFGNQFADVVEWEEFREDMIFWKWNNKEIKKGSKLVIRPGQDAIFLDHGKVEGIFEDEGEYDIESQIVPFLSTLKGFRFGFNSGMRVEVLFVNTKEFTVRWGTQNPINIQAPGLPGGMPIRANGTFQFKVNDYLALIDKIAGVRNSYLVEDVKIRITAILDQLLMKWIPREGKDMFNLQANAHEIGAGIQDDLNMELMDDGMKIMGFQIMSFNYPKEIQDMINKNASYGMVGDMKKYQQVSMTDAMASGKSSGAGNAADMAGMMMGMGMAKEMMEGMKDGGQAQTPPKNEEAASESTGQAPNFCPNCGQKTEGAKFCSNCGQKLY